jgi:signal transduction histidine kinase
MTGEDDLALPAETRVTAYRIAKEALVNARKHADARQVVIDVRAHDGGVVVTISDDGVGFDAGSASIRDRPGHHGLANMSDRAEVAGGHLRVQRPPVGGTEVRLWLPHG